MGNILNRVYGRQRRDYGENISGELLSSNNYYINNDFDMDSLLEFGFGWCEHYKSGKNGERLGAYELFIEDNSGQEIRVYYIPELLELIIEHIAEDSYLLSDMFKRELREIGMLLDESGNCDNKTKIKVLES